jgi:TolB-like protein
LISDLSGLDAVRIVERDRLEAVLKELKLGQSSKFDSDTAAKVGKLLGAKFLVLGGYFDLAGTLRIDARVVEVETGKIVESSGVNGKVDDFLDLEQKLSGRLAEFFRTELKVGDKPPRAALVKQPSHLSARVAILYSHALNEKDRGDKVKARETLKAVVKEQGDFALATVDLDKLMQ